MTHDEVDRVAIRDDPNIAKSVLGWTPAKTKKEGLQPGSETASGTVETERQRWEGEKKRRETERA